LQRFSNEDLDMIRGLACLALLAGASVRLSAQSEPGLTKLTVHAAAAPVPALRYQLLPELKDMTPGNRALLYQRAHSPEWWGPHYRQRDYEKIDRWLEVPLSMLPRDDMRYLESWGALKEIDLAARRDYCYWEMTQRVKTEGIGMLMPDVQGFREYARLLGVRSRLEMADGKLDRAIYTLQSGFALGRDVANAPTLINALVGINVAHQMADRLEEMMQLPKAPNLYWALTVLPEPFIDLRKPLQGERLLIDSQFPELRTIEATVWTPAQQQAFMTRMGAFALDSGLGRHGSHLEQKLAVVGVVLKAYPEGKRALRAQGRKEADIESLPAMQVALIYLRQNHQKLWDDLYKQVGLPYWQGSVGLREADQDFRAGRARFGLLPFNAFIPATQKVFEARVRLDRRLAALRVIEAIRLYAAAHEGKLPAALNDITEVPIPVDPVSGRGFDYSVSGDRVILRESRLADGRPALLPDPFHYEVTLQR
jgi:hypothetical protein